MFFKQLCMLSLLLPFRAQNNVDMFVLNKEDLDEVLTHYPSIKDQINKVAEDRITAVRKRSEAKVDQAVSP